MVELTGLGMSVGKSQSSFYQVYFRMLGCTCIVTWKGYSDEAEKRGFVV